MMAGRRDINVLARLFPQPDGGAKPNNRREVKTIHLAMDVIRSREFSTHLYSPGFRRPCRTRFKDAHGQIHPHAAHCTIDGPPSWRN